MTIFHQSTMMIQNCAPFWDIDGVRAAQADLVEPLARFEPRIVKMAPSGEPPED